MASPWLFSRLSGEMWQDSAGTGLDLASLILATASRSEACGCDTLRLRAREGAARALTARPCKRVSQAGCGRLGMPRGGASDKVRKRADTDIFQIFSEILRRKNTHDTSPSSIEQAFAQER